MGLVCAALAAPARAVAGPPAWHVDVTPYLWAAGIYGDVTARGLSAPVSASFVDTLENTDSLIGLQGRVGVSRGPWGGFVDGTYLKLKVDDAGATRLDVTSRMALLELGLVYRVLDRPAGEIPGATIDVYGGGRYTYLELDLDTRGQPSANQSRDWADPVVGGRLTWSFSERFFVLAGGDVGGFGVGSDFAWSALGLLGYRWPALGLDWSVLAGYRALGQDYSTGSGRQRFRWDTTMHGPVVGLSIRF